MTQTIFEYTYRDASNYKVHDAIILYGHLSAFAKQAIQDRFEGGRFFIAEQIGLPDLKAKLWIWSDGKSNEDDHEWHEFRDIREATEIDILEYPTWGTVEDFIANIMTVEGWKPELYPCR